MQEMLINMLGAIYTRIPKKYRPPIKKTVYWSLLRGQSLAQLKKIKKGKRIEFLDFEIAYLEPFEFLSPGAGEVFIESLCSTVSPGTETAVLCGLPGARRRFPYEPGYSCTGRILAAGSKVSGFREGDRVTGRIKHTSHCTMRPDGLFKVPDGVSDEESSFIELGIITLQGIRKARILPGDRVAVVGQGLIGQLSNKLSKVAGASRVIAVAASRNREATAIGPGCADEYIAVRETPSAPEEVQADVVVEAVGSPQAVELSMRCAREGGRVVLAGSARGLGRNVDFWSLAQKRSIQIVGAHITAMPDKEASSAFWTYRQEGELFLSLLQEKRLVMSDLVTWRARPEECNAVYEVLAHGGGKHVGIVFHWSE
jgi:threonine dehydrogenase-like Zn-dependent dehydrogenase